MWLEISVSNKKEFVTVVKNFIFEKRNKYQDLGLQVGFAPPLNILY